MTDILDELGGFLDDARQQLARVDSVVRQGESLHRSLSGGGGSSSVQTVSAPDLSEMASTANRWLLPVGILAGVIVLYALANGVRS